MACAYEPPTGTRLEYLFSQAAGFNPSGSEEGPFTLISDDQVVAVFGTDRPPTQSSFQKDCAHVPLDMALKLGANLTVVEGVAICEIGGIKRGGNTYAEAAMRVLLIHLLSKTPSSVI